MEIPDNIYDTDSQSETGSQPVQQEEQEEQEETMTMEEIDERLDRDGYVVVPNVLTSQEVAEYRIEFFNWLKGTDGLEEFHSRFSGNGIFKYFEVAHQRFAWLARTNRNIINIFKHIWKTDDVVTSFDGCCYYPKEYSDEPRLWIHTDQSSQKVGRHCVQSFVSFTENKERTFVLYRGSQHLHQDYFNITNTVTPNDWCVLNPRYLEGLDYRQEFLHVKPGSLVLWDSRVFHQNTCGDPECREERLVQYLCYLPRNHPKNTDQENQTRRECFRQRINTSHWPYPLRPIHKQPSYHGQQVYIEYDGLPVPKIDDLLDKIDAIL